MAPWPGTPSIFIIPINSTITTASTSTLKIFWTRIIALMLQASVLRALMQLFPSGLVFRSFLLIYSFPSRPYGEMSQSNSIGRSLHYTRVGKPISFLVKDETSVAIEFASMPIVPLDTKSEICDVPTAHLVKINRLSNNILSLKGRIIRYKLARQNHRVVYQYSSCIKPYFVVALGTKHR